MTVKHTIAVAVGILVGAGFFGLALWKLRKFCVP